jgi:antitoxin component YwqK of YwqJK toxin-antitoxin module
MSVLLVSALGVTLQGCTEDIVEGTTKVRVDHHPGTPKVIRARHEQVYRDGKWLHHGMAEYFDPMGKQLAYGTYADGLEDGAWVIYTEDGMKSEGHFKAARRMGTWNWYHPTGKLGLSGAYVEEARNGEWTTRDTEGRVTKRATWRHGILHGNTLLYDNSGHVLRTIRYVDGTRAN